jgi:hypothetical protein
MAPDSMLSMRSRCRRPERLPRAGGIAPVSMLLYRNGNSMEDDRFASDSGISPDRRFSWRSST